MRRRKAIGVFALMKRIIFLFILALVFVLFLVACDNSSEEFDYPEVSDEMDADTQVLPEPEPEQEIPEPVEEYEYDYDKTIKFISNLQPNLHIAVPAKKIQLDWIIYGSGGNDTVGRINAEGEPVPLHDSVTGTFSYQFTSADGSISGRVEGDNGELRIFALRENGAFALVRYENGTFYRGADGDTQAYPDEIAAYELAAQFTQHFATLTRAGHDHSHDPLPYNLGNLAVERFPIDFRPIDGDEDNIISENNLHVRDRETDEFIIFFYDGQDTGGMMSGMWLDGVIKWVSNLEPELPEPIVPKKIQLDWIIYGSGGNDTVGRVNAEGEPVALNDSVTGIFSYQFTSEDGCTAGRVVGDNGKLRIYALRENGTFALIRYENGAFFRGADGDTIAYPDEIAAYELAAQFTEHFATLTRAGHDHSHDPLPHNLGVLAVERFPIDFRPIDGDIDNITSENNLHVRDRETHEFIIFFYDGQDTGGMMSAMWLDGTTKWVSNLEPNLPEPIVPKKVQLDWLIHGAGGEDIAGRTDEYGELAPLHDSVTGLFSYQFMSADGSIAGRVEGEHGELRIFALRENGTFALIRYEDGTFYRGADGDTIAYENEAAAYEFAIQFIRYFATMTRVEHTHTFPHPHSSLPTEDFPIYLGSDRIMTFGYDGQNTGGMMRSMILPE